MARKSARPEAFLFFARSWLVKTAHMKPGARGAYITLLASAYTTSPDRCSVPDDDVVIARLAGCTRQEWRWYRDEVRAEWDAVLVDREGIVVAGQSPGCSDTTIRDCLAAGGERRLVNPRLMEEVRRQTEALESQRTAGTLGGKKRWAGRRPAGRSKDSDPIRDSIGSLHLGGGEGKGGGEGRGSVPLPASVPELELSAFTHVPDSKKRSRPTGDSLFDAFWNRYPNPTDKAQTQAAWRRLMRELSDAQRVALAEAIMAGVERWRASERWAAGYVVAPVRFLRWKRWEDVPVPTKEGATAAGRAALDRFTKED